MLFVAVLLALFGDEERPAWSSATLAAGLVLWGDLLFGATALLLVVLEALRQKVQRKQRLRPIVARVTLALVVWTAPLVPGALHTVEEGSTLIHSGDRQSEAAPDLRPENTIPSRMSALLSMAGGGFGLPVGALSVLGLLALCVKRRRAEPGMVLGAALLTASLAATTVELRARNVLFVPMATAAAWFLLLRRRTPEDDPP